MDTVNNNNNNLVLTVKVKVDTTNHPLKIRDMDNRVKGMEVNRVKGMEELNKVKVRDMERNRVNNSRGVMEDLLQGKDKDKDKAVMDNRKEGELIYREMISNPLTALLCYWRGCDGSRADALHIIPGDSG